MIKCAFVDNDRKSRQIIEAMLCKMKGVRLVKSCASIDAANTCLKKTPVQALYIRLHQFPVPEEHLLLLKEIKESGIQIIILSSSMKIIYKTLACKATDYIMFPLTRGRLSKSFAKVSSIMMTGTD